MGILQKVTLLGLHSLLIYCVFYVLFYVLLFYLYCYQCYAVCCMNVFCRLLPPANVSML